MKIVERTSFEITVGMQDQVKPLEERFATVETPLGFPPKRRYQCIAGYHPVDLYIYERDWESFEARAAALERSAADPRIQELLKEAYAVFNRQTTEFYILLG